MAASFPPLIIGRVTGTAADGGSFANVQSVATNAIPQSSLSGILATVAPITNASLLGNPTTPTASANDNSLLIANTAWVQALIGLFTNGYAVYTAVAAVSTSNITVSSPGTTFDGYTANTGDRLLLTGQTTATQNGIWIFNGSTSALTHASDWSGTIASTGKIPYTFSLNGTVNANVAWSCITTGSIVVGTTVTVWTQVNAPGVNDAIARALINTTQTQIDNGLVGSTGGISSGVVIDPAGGHIVFNATPGDAHSLVISNITSGVYAEQLRIDTLANIIHAVSLLSIDGGMQAPTQDVVSYGRHIISLLDGFPKAWSLGGKTGAFFGANTVNDTMFSHMPTADYQMASSSLIHRGNRLERQITIPQTFDGSINFTYNIQQGSAMTAKSLRTHQEVISGCLVGTRMWAVWGALNATLGGSSAELAGEYIVMAYTDDPTRATGWTEVIQIHIGDPTTDAVVDTHLAYWKGSLWLFFGAHRINAQEDYFGGIRCLRIDNPLANRNYVISGPYLIGYGDMQTPPQEMMGWLMGNMSYGPQQTAPGLVTAEFGFKVGRLWLDDFVGHPTAEVAWLAPYPPVTNGNQSSGATWVMRVNGTVLMICRTPASGDYFTTSSVIDFNHPELITWSVPAPWTGTTPCVTVSRSWMGRSPTGRLARVWNADPSGGRTDMTIAFSEDEGATWPYQFLIDGTSSNISYPCAVCEADKDTWNVFFDRGRGQGTGTPADLLVNRFSETAVVNGNATNIQILVSALGS